MSEIENIKLLRDKTGISVAQCKKALTEAGGDLDRALEVLRSASAAIAEKKSDRTLASGTVSSYIHNHGQSAAILLLACETDFVAKNPEFKILADDLAMQVVAFAPASVDELLALPFIKGDGQTVAETINGAVQKFGERIEVVEFKRLVASE